MPHLRRWKRLDEMAGESGFVVRFNGAQATDFDTSIKRALKLAGIEGNVTAYSLRHTCASWLVQQDVHTRKIAEFLGMLNNYYSALRPPCPELSG